MDTAYAGVLACGPASPMRRVRSLSCRMSRFPSGSEFAGNNTATINPARRRRPDVGQDAGSTFGEVALGLNAVSRTTSWSAFARGHVQFGEDYLGRPFVPASATPGEASIVVVTAGRCRCGASSS